jgi:hypothetical protein
MFVERVHCYVDPHTYSHADLFFSLLEQNFTYPQILHAHAFLDHLSINMFG